MANNRPRARQKNVTGGSLGVKRRGSGLGTGPVGGGRPAGNSGSTGGGSYRGTRSSGGKSSMLYIIIAVVVLLLGGGGHRTGKSSDGWNALESFAAQYFRDAVEVGRWATQDCITLDSMPYIGRYSKSTPNLFVATGFNKWGMSTAFLSAMILSDLVVGKPNRYAHIFSPDRSLLHPKLGVNALEAVCNLLTPTKPRCPHLGCALKYNRYEHSWDCPCHGSRFSEDGEVLNNPATANMKKHP